MKQNSNKMNLGQLAGLVIFVLLFSLASNSLTNFAFATENISHEKPNITSAGDYYKTNLNVPKDKSIETKVKEAKEKLEAAMNQLKANANSNHKGYSEKITDVTSTAKTKVDIKAYIKAVEDSHKTNVNVPIDKTPKKSS
jgi:hypothetical protein